MGSFVFRYLSKNYRLAKEHVSPDVVVFLGDLFDEGSIANDPEYRRYFQRFRNIFDLPTNQNPSEVVRLFLNHFIQKCTVVACL